MVGLFLGRRDAQLEGYVMVEYFLGRSTSDAGLRAAPRTSCITQTPLASSGLRADGRGLGARCRRDSCGESLVSVHVDSPLCVCWGFSNAQFGEATLAPFDGRAFIWARHASRFIRTCRVRLCRAADTTRRKGCRPQKPRSRFSGVGRCLRLLSGLWCGVPP